MKLDPADGGDHGSRGHRCQPRGSRVGQGVAGCVRAAVAALRLGPPLRQLVLRSARGSRPAEASGASLRLSAARASNHRPPRDGCCQELPPLSSTPAPLSTPPGFTRDERHERQSSLSQHRPRRAPSHPATAPAAVKPQDALLPDDNEASPPACHGTVSRLTYFVHTPRTRTPVTPLRRRLAVQPHEALRLTEWLAWSRRSLIDISRRLCTGVHSTCSPLPCPRSHVSPPPALPRTYGEGKPVGLSPLGV